MRLPRLHFTLRWLMAAVAIAGLLIGGWCEIQRRRDAFLEKADWHASRARNDGVLFGSLVGGLHWFNMKGEILPANQFPSPAKNEWHLLLIDKYKYASNHPWMPVAPDPPEPE